MTSTAQVQVGAASRAGAEQLCFAVLRGETHGKVPPGTTTFCTKKGV